MEKILPKARNGLTGYILGNLEECGKSPVKSLGGVRRRLGAFFPYLASTAQSGGTE